MELQLFKPLWGHQGGFSRACRQAKEAGFNGIEGPAPEGFDEREQWRELLQCYDLQYIAEICTAGSYVPERHANLQQHLDSLEKKLLSSMGLSPRFVTCLGGCDAWEESLSVEFFGKAIELAKQYQTTISFETHRGRSLFNPWVTQRMCQQLPEIKLTCDFSHWCVVCERLLAGEETTLADIFPHAFHIHARVGYDQGPQVPAPQSDWYQDALDAHQRWWCLIWREKVNNGDKIVTMTPEFGPDGYQTVDINTQKPVGDLWAMNCWMAEKQRSRFAEFRKMALQKQG